ncbi:MAG: HD domain-containing protein [Bacillaceae bacterium]|nr:HD domain-containing protein [Bacillaceae bacterium]
MLFDDKRLAQQIRFITEIDRLKNVYRQSILMDSSRRENSAEHSWHLAMMALILSEYADSDQLDLLRVIKMVVIHDLVEIDAGDTFAYDDEGRKDQKEREEKAAERIFGLLPEDQRNEIYDIWHEFEEQDTAEARFARALDRLQPLLHNYFTRGESWQKNKVRASQVYERNQPIEEGSEVLWQFATKLIRDAVERNYLSP